MQGAGTVCCQPCGNASAGLSRKNISGRQFNGYPNGVITLKGGELDDELGQYKNITIVEPLLSYFPDDEFFSTKCITYTPVNK